METTFPDSSLPPQAESQTTPSSPPVDPVVFSKAAEEVLSAMLPLLSFQATMSSTIEKDMIRIRLVCEDAGRLIGRRGLIINEIQFLTNRILQSRYKMAPRVFLDVDDPPGSEKKTEKKMESPPRMEKEKPSVREEREPPLFRKERERTESRGEKGWQPVVLSTPPPVAPVPKAEVPEVPLVPREALHGVIAQAEAVANQVRRWGDPMELGAMNAEDRRLVEEYFRKDRELEAVVVEAKGGPADMRKIRIQVKQK